MLISWVVEGSTSWMPYQRTFRNFTHRAWAIWDLSDHEIFWMIPHPGSQKRITLSLESISRIPFQARTSYVKIWQCRQQYSNRGMPCHVHIPDTIRGTSNHPNEYPGTCHKFMADIFSIISNCETQLPGMLISWIFREVKLVRCTNDWHEHHSSSRQILRIPPPVACGHFVVYSATFWVREAHRFKVEVYLKWEMFQQELITFEKISVV